MIKYQFTNEEKEMLRAGKVTSLSFFVLDGDIDDRFAVCEALLTFGHDWHDGQWSASYALGCIPSREGFRPNGNVVSEFTNALEDPDHWSEGTELYRALMDVFGITHE